MIFQPIFVWVNCKTPGKPPYLINFSKKVQKSLKKLLTRQLGKSKLSPCASGESASATEVQRRTFEYKNLHNWIL